MQAKLWVAALANEISEMSISKVTYVRLDLQQRYLRR